MMAPCVFKLNREYCLMLLPYKLVSDYACFFVRYWIAGRRLSFWWVRQRPYSHRYLFSVLCLHMMMYVKSCYKNQHSTLTENCFFLMFQADSFHRHGRELRRKMWLQNLRFKLMVGGGIAALILIIWLMVCRGFKC